MKILDGHGLMSEPGVDRFKTASIFGALSDEAIRFLLGRGRILALEDGEELFHAGDPGDSFYVVLEGEFNYFRQAGKGEVLLRSAGFGEQLGYVSMVGLFPRVGVGKAKGPTVVLEINSDLFYQFHEALPFDFGIVMLNLARDMSRTIIFLTHQLADSRADEPVT
jgi:CRP-like cAMP-binding protein